jgi:hypothetical protein
VTDVGSSAAFREQGEGGPTWTGPHPPASESADRQSPRAALA